MTVCFQTTCTQTYIAIPNAVFATPSNNFHKYCGQVLADDDGGAGTVRSQVLGKDDTAG